MRIWLSTKTQDEEFNDLRAAGHTGSLNDMQFAYLAAAGYSGALADKMAAARGGDFTAPVLSGNSFNDTDDEATFTTTEGGTFVWATHLTTETLTANGSGGWTGTLLESGTDTVASSGESTISAAYTATTGTGGESRKFSYYVRDAAGNDSNVITEAFTVNATSWAADFSGGSDLLAGAGLTSGGPSQQLTLATWIYCPTLPTGDNYPLWFWGGGSIALINQNAARPRFLIKNAAGTTLHHFQGNTGTLVTGAWRFLAVSWDLSVPTFSWCINDTNPTTNTITALTASTTEQVGDFTSIKVGSDGTSPFDGYVSECWAAHTYYDLNDSGVRANFYDAVNTQPADMTGFGSPFLWLKDRLGTNAGSAGDLATTGSEIPAAPSTPWD